MSKPTLIGQLSEGVRGVVLESVRAWIPTEVIWGRPGKGLWLLVWVGLVWAGLLMWAGLVWVGLE